MNRFSLQYAGLNHLCLRDFWTQNNQICLGGGILAFFALGDRDRGLTLLRLCEGERFIC